MLTRTFAGLEFALDHPEIVGRRVLITGAASELGLEVVRLFAEHGARLALHCDDDSRATQARMAVATQDALAVERVNGSVASHHDTLHMARASAQVFGGLDMAVNIAMLPELEDASQLGVERTVSAALMLPTLVTQVVANRMRTSLTEGMILNVLASRPHASPRQRAAEGFARTALAALTRGEAAAWGPYGIRINAVAPPTGLVRHTDDYVCGMPDVASLALHMAGDRSSRLSGLVLEGWCG